MSRGAHDVVEVRDLDVDDVPALIACVRRCYGESYTEREFYDPEYLRDEMRSGRLRSAGAVVGTRVVAHVGTRVGSPGDVVAETVGGIVDPDFRGAGLLRRVGGQMTARYGELGIAATIHYATGVHDRTQRPIASSGGVPTGVLLGHVAAGTDYRGITHAFADARIGVVVYFQAYGRLEALDVCIPERYVDRVGDLYGRMDLERRVMSEPYAAGPVQSWVTSVHHDTRRGISLLRCGSLSDEKRDSATEFISRALTECQEVTYADVQIADPRCLELFDILEAHGFFFGALLPGNARTEAIRLQRLTACSVAPDKIMTASPDGRSLLEWITQQHQRVVTAQREAKPRATNTTPDQPQDRKMGTIG
jgi:hypothetical protein